MNPTKTYMLRIVTPDRDFDLTVTHQVAAENNEIIQVTIAADLRGTAVSVSAETTEAALIRLANILPENWHIRSCISCRYGHFCPVGDADNEVFCVTEFQPKQICDLWHVTEDPSERRKRSRSLFHVCPTYQSQSDAYFTYSDYRFNVNDH